MALRMSNALLLGPLGKPVMLVVCDRETGDHREARRRPMKRRYMMLALGNEDFLDFITIPLPWMTSRAVMATFTLVGCDSSKRLQSVVRRPSKMSADCAANGGDESGSWSSPVVVSVEREGGALLPLTVVVDGGVPKDDEKIAMGCRARRFWDGSGRGHIVVAGEGGRYLGRRTTRGRGDSRILQSRIWVLHAGLEG
ncbi:hypothetical protein DFP72DRAFT_856460 [Ephemerocybe angulata]|uniref:Uncharacterized protein n=1 Tax=Ephemerocybe angulata TaxID=980116 RepID=A0A8H6HFS3_9AGAR|nr:hypothetical protein DFP72DRAFT_856460 [Tulosesus angulatus]